MKYTVTIAQERGEGKTIEFFSGEEVDAYVNRNFTCDTQFVCIKKEANHDPQTHARQSDENQ